MATKSKSRTSKRSASAKRSTAKARTTSRTATRKAGPTTVKPNPNPGAMPQSEQLNRDSTKPKLAVKHNFQPGEEIALWPASHVTKRMLKGEEEFRTAVASRTVREDGSINTEGLGKGKWVLGGPAGYSLKDRYIEVTVK